MSPDRQILDGLRIDRKAAPRRLPAVVLLLAVLILVSAAVGAAWWFNGPKPLPVHTVVAREVSAAADGRGGGGGGGGERTLLNASGYVTARREATVSSKVTGKVTEVLVEEGMK